MDEVFLIVVYGLFYGGIGCLFPFLPGHLRDLGLSDLEIGILTSMTSLASVFTLPLLALGTRSKRSLRPWIIFFCILNFLLCFGLLLVPRYRHTENPSKPSILTCSRDGATITQEKCSDKCYTSQQVRRINAHSCKVIEPETVDESSATAPSANENLRISGATQSMPPRNATVEEPEALCPEMEEDTASDLTGDELHSLCQKLATKKLPHVCFSTSNATQCHVFTEPTSNLSLDFAYNFFTDLGNQCVYPLRSVGVSGGEFSNASCRLPQGGLLICEIEDPDMCVYSTGKREVAFWGALILVSLLETAIVVAAVLLGIFAILRAKLQADKYSASQKRLTCASFNSEDSIIIKPLKTDEKTSFERLTLPATHWTAALSSYAAFTVAVSFLPGISNINFEVVVGALLFGATALVLGVEPKDGIGGAETRETALNEMFRVTFKNLCSVMKNRTVVGVILTQIALGSMFGVGNAVLRWRINNTKIAPFVVAASCIILCLLGMPAVALVKRTNKAVGYWNVFLISLCVHAIRLLAHLLWTSTTGYLMIEILEVITDLTAWVAGLVALEKALTHHLVTAWAASLISFFSIGRSFGTLISTVGTYYINTEITLILSASVCMSIVIVWLLFEHGGLRLRKKRRTWPASKPMPVGSLGTL